MISGNFGLPGCGKTTQAAKKARQINRKIERDRKRVARGKKRLCKYDYVLTNFECKGCYKIDFSDIGIYNITNCAIVLDELTIDADSRDFKNFKRSSVEGFIYHRHYDNDIWWFTQQWDSIDKKIRNLTSDLWYSTKLLLFPFSEFTVARRIFRTIKINEYTGEIQYGYRFPNVFERILALFGLIHLKSITFRPLYYKDFDSFSRPLKLKKFKYIPWYDDGSASEQSPTVII